MKRELSDFGKCFASIRKKRKQTLKEASKLLGCSPSLLSAIEHGDRSVSKELVNRIMSKYDLSTYEEQELKITASISSPEKVTINEVADALYNFAKNMSKSPQEEKIMLTQFKKFIESFAKDKTFDFFNNK